MGAFDYDFGALDDADNPLTKSYADLVYDHLSPPSVVQGSRCADHPPPPTPQFHGLRESFPITYFLHVHDEMVPRIDHMAIR